MALFETTRHEPLIEAGWSEGTARAAIEQIATDTERTFTEDGLWPIHPTDVSEERPSGSIKAVYSGAAGVILALIRLQDAGLAARTRDYRPTVGELLQRHRADLNENEVMAKYYSDNGGGPTFLFGDAGFLLLRWILEPSEELATDLYTAIADKVGDPRGTIWGAPGSMLAALFMLERAGEARWKELYVQHVNALWAIWEHDPALDCFLWTSNIYGSVGKPFGALHGFAGSAFSLLKGREHLGKDRQAELLARVQRTLMATAVREHGQANWLTSVDSFTQPNAPRRLQHCNGAPGIVNVFAQLPTDAETDRLLRDAGELIWIAGPPAKLPCLCHGTAGSGYAFLKLYERTGDDEWLMRARRFAMHAVAQIDRFAERYGQRKYSLWTGDLGLAIYLADCIRAKPAFPTLDTF